MIWAFNILSGTEEKNCLYLYASKADGLLCSYCGLGIDVGLDGLKGLFQPKRSCDVSTAAAALLSRGSVRWPVRGVAHQQRR